jgi:hypothetical protein
MKIKSVDQSTWGKTMTVPVQGEVKVSEEGTISVSEEAAEVLLEHPAMFVEVEEGSKNKKKQKEVEEVEEQSDNEKDAVEEILTAKSFKWLVKTIKNIDGLKEKQKEKYSKSKEIAVKFLVDNFTAEEIKSLL